MASSRTRATIISYIASRIYFLLIIFQVPLFRVSCRFGICTTPVEVASSNLIASDVCPATVVKAFLYPGAVANALIKNKTIPSYNDLMLNAHDFTSVKVAPARTDLRHLELVTGSYLCVVGALLGLLRRGRISLFGTVLVLWGIMKEDFLRAPQNGDGTKANSIYPTMFIAVLSAFLSIRGDVRKIVHSYRAQHVEKPPWATSKAKHK
ncbi:uncharacterized protein LOC131157183 [Malania oleifera]|uniref:uncharacterized protein LOC131157183 n=1 Tax=Malania oleifera TaxID=397392 RepID=UPI0025ADD023|nr:uncharacterized protein LOC131157183 [Malania oleifera]